MTSNFRTSRTARPSAVALLAVACSALGALTAQAHVRVLPDSTAAGSFSALTFRVPNESATAGTVKLTVQLPQDKPLLYVSAKPVPGWTVTRTEAPLPQPVKSEGTTITKAVRTVTWTAAGGSRIGPGEYQEFSLSVGPLPDPGTVLLPAEQTYSDDTVVRWDEPTPASGEEPEHPAPALQISAAQQGDDHGPATSTSAATAGGTRDVTARLLGGAGLLLGAAGLATAALVGRRRRGTSGGAS